MSRSAIEEIANEMAHFIRELIIASDAREDEGSKRTPYAEAHYQKAVALLKAYGKGLAEVTRRPALTRCRRPGHFRPIGETNMQTFKTRETNVQAMNLSEDNKAEVEAFIGQPFNLMKEGDRNFVSSFNGYDLDAYAGDWIVKDEAGKFHAVPPHLFEALFTA